MGLFTAQGWIDFSWVEKQNCAFNILLGGRGIGKTFGCLESNLIANPCNFVLARRTDKQLAQIMKPDQDPTIDLNIKHGTDFAILSPPKEGMHIYRAELDEVTGKKKPKSAPLASLISMSTVANARGTGGGVLFDAIVFDEFIKKQYERPFKGEDTAFFDLYETLNRNRELPPPMGEGRPPLKAYLLSNSDQIDNPILASFGLIGQIVKMQNECKRTGLSQMLIDRERSILVVYYADSPISRAKANTALYKALPGRSSYAGMAIDNAFQDVDTSDIKSMPLREYVPIINVGEVTVYEHKGGRGFYVTAHKMLAPVSYGSGSEELEKFSRKYRKLYNAWIEDKVTFEDYGAKICFKHYFSY